MSLVQALIFGGGKGKGGGSTSSVAKDPFTETIEIANLIQHSPTYNQTGAITLAKGAASTFINGEYVTPINTNGDAIDKTNDCVWLYNDYSGQVSLFYLSAKLLPDGKIGLFLVNSVASAAAPTLQAANTDNEGNKVLLEFDVAMADPTGKESEFSLSGGKTITSVQLNVSDNKIIELLVDTPYISTDVITCSYTKGTIVSADLVNLESFANESVINDVLSLVTLFTYRPQLSTSYVAPTTPIFAINDTIEIEVKFESVNVPSVNNKNFMGYYVPPAGAYINNGIYIIIGSNGNYWVEFGDLGFTDTGIVYLAGVHVAKLNKTGLYINDVLVYSIPGGTLYEYNPEVPQAIWICGTNNNGNPQNVATQVEFHYHKIRLNGELVGYYTARNTGDQNSIIENITGDIITPNANVIVTAV